MLFVDENYVYNQEEIDTGVQVATVITQHGFAYKTKLSFADNMITAEYLFYDGTDEHYNGEIIFDFNGEKISVIAVNGIATVPFEVIDPGTYIVKTANLDIENGEVIINV